MFRTDAAIVIVVVEVIAGIEVHRACSSQSRHQGWHIGSDLAGIQQAGTVVAEQHTAVVQVEDERISATIGNHQPVRWPVVDPFAADAMPSIAGLLAPQALQWRYPDIKAGNGDAGAANLGIDLFAQRPDLRVERRQCRGQRERALPVTLVLRMQQPEAGE
ncbi:TPA: hypothetical protein UL938_004544 [Stenotrophomonas maltophilia]|nr:hypothetical protein [Stenotrophomonas maltophilia]HEL3014212.1 hypothetical protein [Stenotrophomonas maltophilia]